MKRTDQYRQEPVNRKLSAAMLAGAFWCFCLLSGTARIHATTHSDPVTGHITRAFCTDSGPEPIVTTTEGTRVVTFGEDSQTMCFDGQMRGTTRASIRYYWTFENGTPSRYPAYGVTVHCDSAKVKFVAAGSVHFHVVDKDRPEIDLAEDTVVVCHLAFEQQLVRDKNGKVVVDPYGDTSKDYFREFSGRRGRTDYILRTDPPLKDFYLGHLVSSKRKSETVLPPCAITDRAGCFRFTVEGNMDDKEWGSLKLVDDPTNPTPAQIRRLAAKNLAILKADTPPDVSITADPVTFYKIEADEKPGTIEAIPAYRLRLPPGDAQRFQCVDDHLADGFLSALLLDPKRKDSQKVVHYYLPKPVLSALNSVKDTPLPHMGYGDWFRWRYEDGEFYVQIPKVLRIAYQTDDPPDTEDPRLYAVTFLPRNGVLAVLFEPWGKDVQLMGINAASGKVEWEIPFPKEEANRLAWINDDLVLGLLEARHYTSYFIMSLSKKKVIARGGAKDSEGYFISNGALVTPDPDIRNLRVLFSFPKAAEPPR